MLIKAQCVLKSFAVYVFPLQSGAKVALLGASGGIGQALGLLLKLNSLVAHLALYDVAPVTPGVGADLSHINTRARVTAHKGTEQLDEVLSDANVVLITAGIPRKPGTFVGNCRV